MWHIGIGPIELVLLAFVGASLVCPGKRARRWAIGIVPITILSIIVTPPDPISALIVGVPLVTAFVTGVYAASYVRSHNGIPV